MFRHDKTEANDVRRLIRSGEVTLAGNGRLKIYGKLDCKSGKRMQRKHRVFFKDAGDAERYGYRPCGHCMKVEYRRCIVSTPDAKSI